MSTPVDLYHHIEGGEYELSREELGDSRFYRSPSQELRDRMSKGQNQQPDQQQQQPQQGEEGGQQEPPKLLEGGKGKQEPEVLSSAASPQEEEVAPITTN